MIELFRVTGVAAAVTAAVLTLGGATVNGDVTFTVVRDSLRPPRAGAFTEVERPT
jgi:hypothetical protein